MTRGSYTYLCIFLFLIFAANIQAGGKDAAAKAIRHNLQEITGSQQAVKGTPIMVPDSNDSCASAFVIGADNVYIGSTAFATTDGDSNCGGTNDVWFSITPSQSITHYFTASGFGTVISLHSGCPGTPDNMLTCNDDFDGASIDWSLTQGQTYYLRLAGYEGETGTYMLEVIATDAQVAFAVDETGNFTIGQLGGGAVSDMLYGHPYPWSGGTSVRVDNQTLWNYDLGDNSNPLPAPSTGPVDEGNVNRTVWTVNGIQVTQRLEVIAVGESELRDTVSISYELRNTGGATRNAGLRIFLDTYLGLNDGTPFQVPGLGDVTRERELSGNGIPQFWTGFDDLVNPSRTVQCSLINELGPPPDRVVWGAWPEMSDHVWEYTIDPNRSLTSDSAFYAYWDPIALAPGQVRTMGITYGLSMLDLDLNPPIAVGVVAPGSLDVVGHRYQPNPVGISAFLQNSLDGAEPRTGVFAEIDLPEGMTLVGDNARQEIGDMAVNAAANASWFVEVALQQAEESELLPDGIVAFPYSIRVGADGQADKVVLRTLSVQALENDARYWNLFQ